MKFHSILRAVLVFLVVSINQVSYSQKESFVMTQIGPDNLLNVPWDLHYGPDGYLWITEKNDGVVVRVNPINAVRDELIQLSDLSSTGGQDGLLGMTFHDEFQSGSPYIYLSYTHSVSGKRKQKLVRYAYSIDGDDGTLSSPLVLIDNLPSSNDHQSGRIRIGPDKKLYYTIGDQGVKDCGTNLAQFLPTQEEIDQKNWANYPGKVLRLELDGSIPEDNPELNGVKSHIYSYGHRNPQGLIFGSNGVLYSDEHGPRSDDEVNIIYPGRNYGWPYVAGIKDNLVYESDGCHTAETSFAEPNYQDPLLSMFLPDADKDPSCTDSWMCRPNIAPSSIDIYESEIIPGWMNSLLITSLKKGRVYKVQLDAAGTTVVGEPVQYFYTTNRYRDIAIDPDGKTFYIITDGSGKTADASGMNIETNLQNPGAILKFTYQEPISLAKPETYTSFNIWPNPAKNTLFIEVNNDNNHDLQGELINSMGQVVQRFAKLSLGINEVQISGLATGIYILNLRGEGYYRQKRVVLN